MNLPDTHQESSILLQGCLVAGWRVGQYCVQGVLVGADDTCKCLDMGSEAGSREGPDSFSLF